MRESRFPEKLNLRLPPKLAGALARACDREEVSASEFARRALRSALKRELPHEEPTP
jgi:predicted HicB family RNase H-like nuclease